MSYEGSLNNEVQLGASSSAAAKHLEAVPEEMGTNVGQQPTFHIPDSNASDVAPSDCSSYYKKDWPSNQLTKTEALSGSQHVVLWLTRTSMSDLPSVPSLKNLVQNSLFGPTPKRPEKPPKNATEKSIQRNFSTKSFLKFSSKQEEEEASPAIRKCETVIALSGMSSSASNASSSKKSASGVKSPLSSVFKNIAGNKNVQPTTTVEKPPSVTTENGRNLESPYPGLQPRNRLRSAASSVICSRCTSVLSVNHSRVASRCTSQISLFNRKSSRNEATILCKICLVDYSSKDTYSLQLCHCVFCKECLHQYLSFEIMAGAYEISCPDALCEKEGVFSLEEIEKIVGKDLFEKHKAFRLNTEVALDSNRAWCPKPGCNTICHICASSTTLNTPAPRKARAVNCPKCEKEFCSSCSSNWHAGLSCQEHARNVVMQNMSETVDPLLLLDEDGNIKQCPVCKVPIERDAGCAQMMCKKCKHVFCWFCLGSLDDDFLLRHYDSGKCKGKLGHTRASLLWHRAQVIGIFAGFVVLLLVASPLLLIAAPCIFCCRCKSCTELEEELENANPTRSNSRSNSGIAIQIIP